jgi:hypothetical protein
LIQSISQSAFPNPFINTAGDDYTTTWWNGRGELVHKTDITTLPTRPGEGVAIKRIRTEHPSND